MKLPKSPSYYMCLDRIKDIAAKTYNRKGYHHRLNEIGNYSKKKGDVDESYIPEEITIVQRDLSNGLGHKATQLLFVIIRELKYNNALWEYDARRNSRDRAAIAQLRKAQILFPTENTCVHIVNPEYIRRGNLHAVWACTTELLGTVSRVTPELIKKLDRDSVILPELLSWSGNQKGS